MDLSFARFDRDTNVTILPTDLAVLLVGVAARQAASTTARIQSALAPVAAESLLAPAHGAFSESTAAALTRWQQE